MSFSAILIAITIGAVVAVILGLILNRSGISGKFSILIAVLVFIAVSALYCWAKINFSDVMAIWGL